MAKLKRTKSVATSRPPRGVPKRVVARKRARPGTSHGKSAAKSNKRAAQSAARRDAILEAALDEFSARGFAAARLDDVAQRAGVAKGTIYVHFRDKEELFQELVRAMLVPQIAAVELAAYAHGPLRELIEQFFARFVREIYSTRRRDVLRLVLTEGQRFPKLAEFYYREVVERATMAVRAAMQKAHARGELHDDSLARFPQLVVAPALVAIMWNGLFERFAPLDVPALLRAHLDLLFGPGRAP